MSDTYWGKNNEKQDINEQVTRERVTKMAPVLNSLFWLILPANIASVLEWFGIDALTLIGDALGLVCTAIYCILLFKLKSEADGYVPASICGLVTVAAEALELILFGNDGTPTAWLLVSVPAAIVRIYGIHKEYTAHSDALAGLDFDLSEKWLRLWKFQIGFLISSVASLVLFFVPMLMAVAYIVSVVGLLIASVMKFVYLYQSAKLCRDWATHQHYH